MDATQDTPSAARQSEALQARELLVRLDMYSLLERLGGPAAAIRAVASEFGIADAQSLLVMARKKTLRDNLKADHVRMWSLYNKGFPAAMRRAFPDDQATFEKQYNAWYIDHQAFDLNKMLRIAAPWFSYVLFDDARHARLTVFRAPNETAMHSVASMTQAGPCAPVPDALSMPESAAVPAHSPTTVPATAQRTSDTQAEAPTTTRKEAAGLRALDYVLDVMDEGCRIPISELSVILCSHLPGPSTARRRTALAVYRARTSPAGRALGAGFEDLSAYTDQDGGVFFAHPCALIRLIGGADKPQYFAFLPRERRVYWIGELGQSSVGEAVGTIARSLGRANTSPVLPPV
jgi:hypothetical protein